MDMYIKTYIGLFLLQLQTEAFKSRKQIYIHEVKIQKYHYFNQCIQRFAYHTSNHNYHEYKFVYYINANAAAATAAATTNNKVTGTALLNAFSCAEKEPRHWQEGWSTKKGSTALQSSLNSTTLSFPRYLNTLINKYHSATYYK